MSLDKLYHVMRKAKYPIHNRDELKRVLGDFKINIEGNLLNADEIAVHIPKYPLRSVADFFYNFLSEEYEIHEKKEALILGDFEKNLAKMHWFFFLFFWINLYTT